MEEAGFSFELVRSSRKSLALQIQEDGSILVRAPMRLPEDQIRTFVREKSGWLLVHRQKMEERLRERSRETVPLLAAQQREFRELARTVFSERVAYFAPLVGVTYGRITIRDQKTRWGSCSRAGNLNFNFRLVMAPPEVLDYVVVHELCHRRQMNHSEAFWREVARILPDYGQHRAWLRQNGWRLLG